MRNIPAFPPAQCRRTRTTAAFLRIVDVVFLVVAFGGLQVLLLLTSSSSIHQGRLSTVRAGSPYSASTPKSSSSSATSLRPGSSVSGSPFLDRWHPPRGGASNDDSDHNTTEAVVVAAEAGRTPVDEADEEEGESSSDWDDSLIMGEEDPFGTASILVEIEKNNKEKQQQQQYQNRDAQNNTTNMIQPPKKTEEEPVDEAILPTPHHGVVNFQQQPNDSIPTKAIAVEGQYPEAQISQQRLRAPPRLSSASLSPPPLPDSTTTTTTTTTAVVAEPPRPQPSPSSEQPQILPYQEHVVGQEPKKEAATAPHNATNSSDEQQRKQPPPQPQQQQQQQQKGQPQQQDPPPVSKRPRTTEHPSNKKPLETLEKLQQLLDDTDYITLSSSLSSSSSSPPPATVFQTDAKTDPSLPSPLPLPSSLWTSQDRTKYKKQQRRQEEKRRRNRPQDQQQQQQQQQQPQPHEPPPFVWTTDTFEEKEQSDTEDGLGYTLPNLPIYMSDDELELEEEDYNQNRQGGGGDDLTTLQDASTSLLSSSIAGHTPPAPNPLHRQQQQQPPPPLPPPRLPFPSTQSQIIPPSSPPLTMHQQQELAMMQYQQYLQQQQRALFFAQQQQQQQGQSPPPFLTNHQQQQQYFGRQFQQQQQQLPPTQFTAMQPPPPSGYHGYTGNNGNTNTHNNKSNSNTNDQNSIQQSPPPPTPLYYNNDGTVVSPYSTQQPPPYPYYPYHNNHNNRFFSRIPRIKPTIIPRYPDSSHTNHQQQQPSSPLTNANTYPHGIAKENEGQQTNQIGGEGGILNDPNGGIDEQELASSLSESNTMGQQQRHWEQQQQLHYQMLKQYNQYQLGPYTTYNTVDGTSYTDVIDATNRNYQAMIRTVRAIVIGTLHTLNTIRKISVVVGVIGILCYSAVAPRNLPYVEYNTKLYSNLKYAALVILPPILGHNIFIIDWKQLHLYFCNGSTNKHSNTSRSSAPTSSMNEPSDFESNEAVAVENKTTIPPATITTTQTTTQKRSSTSSHPLHIMINTFYTSFLYGYVLIFVLEIMWTTILRLATFLVFEPKEMFGIDISDHPWVSNSLGFVKNLIDGGTSSGGATLNFEDGIGLRSGSNINNNNIGSSSATTPPLLEISTNNISTLLILPWVLREYKYRPKRITLLVADIVTSCIACPIIEEVMKLRLLQWTIPLSKNYNWVKKLSKNKKKKKNKMIAEPIEDSDDDAIVDSAITTDVQRQRPLDGKVTNINHYVSGMVAVSLGIKLADAIRRVCMYTRVDDEQKCLYAFLRGLFPVQELCGVMTALRLARRDVLGQRMPLWNLLLPAIIIHAMANLRGMKPIFKWNSSTPWSEMQLPPNLFSSSAVPPLSSEGGTATKIQLLSKAFPKIMWLIILFRVTGYCVKNYFMINRQAMKRTTTYAGKHAAFSAELETTKMLKATKKD